MSKRLKSMVFWARFQPESVFTYVYLMPTSDLFSYKPSSHIRFVCYKVLKLHQVAFFLRKNPLFLSDSVL